MENKAQNSAPIKFNWKKVINRLTIIISIGVVLNVFLVYFLTDDFKPSLFLEFNPFYLFLAVVFGVLPMIIHAFEIKLWAHYFDLHLSFKNSFRISVSTILGSAATPTMLGGGPVKWGMLMHYGLRSGQAAAVTTFTGLQDFVFLLMVITFSVFTSDRVGVDVFRKLFVKMTDKLPITLLIIAGVVLVIFILFKVLQQTSRGQKIIQFLKTALTDFKQAYAMLAKHGKWYFLAAVGTTTLRWMSRFLVVLWLVLGLGIQTDYLDVVLSNWLVFTSMTAVPTPGAAGGAEAVFYLVYKPLIPAHYLALVMFAWRFCTEYMRLIFAAVSVNLLGITES